MELIDSKYTREKYKELGIEFTDWQKATIIWNKPMPRQERLNALKELADKIIDLELKKQIEERVSYERKLLSRIIQNPNNDYVYIVRDSKSGCDYGAFYVSETAHEHARNLIRKDVEEMCICKIQIVKEADVSTIRSCNRWNPDFLPNKVEIGEYYIDYLDGEVGEVFISKNATIREWWSNESTS